MLQQIDRLVLQPSVGAGQVRRWLLGNGWDLVDEDLVIDDERFYEIVVAERPGTEKNGCRRQGLTIVAISYWKSAQAAGEEAPSAGCIPGQADPGYGKYADSLEARSDSGGQAA